MLYEHHDTRSFALTTTQSRRKARLRRRRGRRAAFAVLLALLVAAVLFALMLSVDSVFSLPQTAHTISNVPYLSQRDGFETGCESVSAAMLLNDCGFDVTVDELCAEYIDRDQPVLIWATIDMEPPVTGITWTVPETGREITWIYPMHCLVLIGYNADSYIFNDPWAGECIAYDKESVDLAYATLYEQAIVLP